MTFDIDCSTIANHSPSEMTVGGSLDKNRPA